MVVQKPVDNIFWSSAKVEKGGYLTLHLVEVREVVLEDLTLHAVVLEDLTLHAVVARLVLVAGALRC